MNEEAEATSFQSSIEEGCATYTAMSAGEEMVASSEVVEGDNRKRVCTGPGGVDQSFKLICVRLIRSYR